MQSDHRSRLVVWLWIAAVCWFAAPLDSFAALLPQIHRAHWIWSDPADAQCELRKAFFLENPPTHAAVLITADNGYELYVNGSFVGSDTGAGSEVWQSVERYDITSRLARGRNVIGIRGSDLGGVRAVIAAVRAEDSQGRVVEFVTDEAWRAAPQGEAGFYSHPEFVEGPHWQDARIIGPMGMAPWGRLAWSPETEAARIPKPLPFELRQPAPDFAWPDAVAFVGDDCSTYVPLRGDAWGLVFRVGDWSRAYTEFDLPCPSKIGRKLFLLHRTNSQPARSQPEVSIFARPESQTQKPNGYSLRTLVDAGTGVLGSPSASFDGRSLLISMAPARESFFHIYRISLEGAPPQALTTGPFHDIDPAELPDGRIVFVSTRIGTFEEYHQPPSRALFRMNADGSEIHPITSTLIFDNEPKVMADGRIVFIRTDNFFDRGKVETHLHSIRPDGTDGLAEVAANVGPDYGTRLRAFGYGSPAPLPDGRLAFISNRGNAIASAGAPERTFQALPGRLGDIAPLPDGRLLGTVLRAAGRHLASDTLAVIDPKDGGVTLIHESSRGAIHSPVFVGSRPRPPVIPDYADSGPANGRPATGFLFCQNARFTTKSKADWSRIRAIRVLGAVALTTRSSHSHIVHVGHETVELGTVPLAEDGSFNIEVPADMPLALQAVDAEGRSELNEMSWLYVRPGERRSCSGCHQPREAAPPLDTHAAALRAPPLKLVGQGDPHRFRGNNAGVTGLMDLQFERFRESASLNRNTLGREPLASRREELTALIDHLQGSDADLKISSAQRAALWRERAAAAGLVQCLNETNREVRVAAALALAACGGHDSVPPLLRVLADSDPAVVAAARIALENLTGHTLPAHEWSAWFASNSSPGTRPIEPPRDRYVVPPSGGPNRVNAELQTAGSWAASESALPVVLRDCSKPEARAESAAKLRSAIVALGHIGGDAARAALREFVRVEAARNVYPIFEKDNRTDNFTFAAESPLNPRTLQEAVRALGQLGDTNALPLFRQLLKTHIDPRTGNLFLVEAIAEALGRIGTSPAEELLIETFARLKEYFEYVGWYSDHPALYACHASPVHARILEALDALGSTRAGAIAPQLIRSVPTDPDRALFLHNDDYEILVGRLLRRSGRGDEVTETCLALLGDSDAKSARDIEKALSTTHPAWAGHPGPENRAAQILSLVCRDAAAEPRVRQAFLRFLAKPEEPVARMLGNPSWTPIRHWTLFYLARELGNLRQSASAEALIPVLSDQLNEARHGRPDPSRPDIHFLHLEYTPCWRAAAAWAFGEIGDRRAWPALLAAVRNLDNAVDVRHAAACALGKLAVASDAEELKQLVAEYPEFSVRKALDGAWRRVSARIPSSTVARRRTQN